MRLTQSIGIQMPPRMENRMKQKVENDKMESGPMCDVPEPFLIPSTLKP